MTTTLPARLGNLAAAAATSVSAEAKALEPKLRAAAEDVAHKLEAWTSSVDAWAEAHFTAETAALHVDAGTAYRASVAEAHALIAEAKTHL